MLAGLGLHHLITQILGRMKFVDFLHSALCCELSMNTKLTLSRYKYCSHCHFTDTGPEWSHCGGDRAMLNS